LDLSKGQLAALEEPSLFSWRFVNPDVETPFLSPQEEQAAIEHDAEQMAADYANEQAAAYADPVETDPVIVQEKANETGEVQYLDVTETVDRDVVIGLPNGEEHTVQADQVIEIVKPVNLPADFADKAHEAMTTPNDKTLPEMIAVIEAKADQILAKVEEEDDDQTVDIEEIEFKQSFVDAGRLDLDDKKTIGGLLLQSGLAMVPNSFGAKARSRYGFEYADAYEIEQDTHEQGYLGMWYAPIDFKDAYAKKLSVRVYKDGGCCVLVLHETMAYVYVNGDLTHAGPRATLIELLS
jgi:hypothetical protein